MMGRVLGRLFSSKDAPLTVCGATTQKVLTLPMNYSIQKLSVPIADAVQRHAAVTPLRLRVTFLSRGIRNTVYDVDSAQKFAQPER